MRVAILANFPVHVIPSLLGAKPPKGHYATWLPPLAEANAQDDGIERIWITLDENATEERRIEIWNQTMIILPTELKGRASTLFKKDRLAINRVLREIKPDLVHGWGTEDVHALAALTSGFPAVISMQGILTHYIFRARTDARTLLQAAIEFLILRRATAVTCESRWAKAIVQRLAPRAEITCVEYGAHVDFFKAAWQPEPERPIALFVGTLDRRKGFQDVLKAFHSPTLQGTELWVVGDGPLGVPEDAPPNVKFLGRLKRPEVIAQMEKAWCLVLPTRADTSPNVVKEARVMGLPVITTPYGGQSDYIEDGRNGYLVEPDDIAALTDRIHRLLSNYTFCRERGAAGWEADRAQFRIELTAEKFRNLYRSLCPTA